ncbi:hypothetical protein [Catenovulum sediminis]|uniref:Uncharacterized protein n=1 Tax=Catenovulum sediminis TaxID=1740262 RepID=A0ABV1RL44_9ALTE
MFYTGNDINEEPDAVLFSTLFNISARPDLYGGGSVMGRSTMTK